MRCPARLALALLALEAALALAPDTAPGRLGPTLGTCQERPHLPLLGLEAWGQRTEGAEWGSVMAEYPDAAQRCPCAGVPGRDVTRSQWAWGVRPQE